MNSDISSLKDTIEKCTSISEEELGKLLIQIHTNTSSNLNCNYYLIACNLTECREYDFINLLHQKVIYYVLHYEEAKSLTSKNAMELTSKVRNSFRGGENTGEIGELILFLILESKKVIQILKKMRLKTSGNVNFFGLDAIHIEIDEKGNTVLHYGESKMLKNFKTGINEALKSIDKFYSNLNKENLEIDLILSNIDEGVFGQHRAIIEDILNPYAPKNNFKKMNSIFVGYVEDFLSEQIKQDTSAFEYYKSRYDEKITGYTDHIAKRIKNYTKIKNKEYVFHLIPFADISDFNNKFLDLLK